MTTADEIARLLAQKGGRALKSAHRSLREGDHDAAANRAYYAMFDMSRAALLRAGIPEAKLPRTHRGVIEAFRRHAVMPGLIDAQLAGALSHAENLRLQADYLVAETDPEEAKKVVSRAQSYVRAVEKAFGLDAGLERDFSLEGEQAKSAQSWQAKYSRKGHGAQETDNGPEAPSRERGIPGPDDDIE